MDFGFNMSLICFVMWSATWQTNCAVQYSAHETVVRQAGSLMWASGQNLHDLFNLVAHPGQHL